MKPLFRITVGPVSYFGLRLLRKNIRLIKKNYPESDVCVCFNHIDLGDDIGAETIDQSNFIDALPYEPKDECWKLYPPRLRIDSHEIFLDNDIVIFNRVPEIDEFLSSGRPLLFEGRTKVYGKYEHRIPESYVAINSGIFGLPPGLNFKQEIIDFCKYDEDRRWTQWCDDQGVVAGILLKMNPIMIKLESVMNYLPEFSFQPKSHWNGIHMIGTNSDKACFDIIKQILVEMC